MKKKNIIIISVIILIILLLLILGLFVFFKNNNVKNNRTKVDIENNTIDDITLDNDIVISKGKVEKIDNFYHFTFNIKNNSKKDIDMSEYRITLADIGGNELDWFSGSYIGVINSNETINYTYDSYIDLSKIEQIIYRK